MTTSRYSEEDIHQGVSLLDKRLRVLFALLCAYRLLPAYRRFSEETGRGNPNELEELAEALALDVQGAEMNAPELEAAVERVTDLIPQEDGGWDEATQPYAEDASAALAYAFRARLTSEPQEAVWASRRVYEAVYYFVSHVVHPLALSDPGVMEEVTSNALVEAEVSRQIRDLQELNELDKLEVTSEKILELLTRSREEADSIFDIRLVSGRP